METTAVETADLNSDSVSSCSIATRNDKRERKHTAQSLPLGITHNMMKKYVVYYREIVYLKNGKTHPREYFKVESHPKLNKPWVSSKSVKVSLLEKLEDANNLVTDLETTNDNSIFDISLETTNHEDANAFVERFVKELPKYTALRIIKSSPSSVTLSLIYDRKDNSNRFRWTSSSTFTINEYVVTTIKSTIFDELKYLQQKLIDKYGVDLFSM